MRKISIVFSLLFLCCAMRAQSNPWTNPIVSPKILTNGDVEFSIYARQAAKVELEGQFMNGKLQMVKDLNGIWTITVNIPQPDIYPYSFFVDGVQISDPSNPSVFPNERFKASLLEMPSANAHYTVNSAVPHGQVTYCTYQSAVLNTMRPLLVYTPAEYGKGDKQYPVLYLISGTTDTEETWFKVGRVNAILDNLIAQGKAEPMIVVMPYGYMMNGTPMPSSLEAAEMYAQFSKELTQCVMPFVENTFRTKNEAKSRAIAGFSRGGGEALYTAFDNLDKFDWLASYSAYLTPQVLDAHFIDYMNDSSKINSELKLLWFGVGKDDFLYQDVVRNMQYFDSKGIMYKQMQTDGGHTWMNARTYLSTTLPLFFKHK